ncbi:EAL domain-containing protein [Rhodococcoides kyotonense]|uniref:EAL domain, c-di-GMP-specific phosphodiesterase class I (Or its enzymatically inactive variant) n=1 Tax=Rhodococcoides kyotonense TaxID=398843 RepID=A0A239KIU2_9NOCA|nr:EAL domain-containing protein [Rhodococcus kyotonensis]SNT17628.1 EAL domain, c-di-GMP-specific phosphodiesterase class I (or its enzymatically inactive variant) [Rhodococcus kyotonensis]
MTVTSMSARAALVAIDSMIPSFQPVVSLDTGVVVGVEALARWPTVAGVDPAEVFALARRRGVVADIDFACRAAAVKEARTCLLGRDLTLFLNFEPSGIGDPARTEAHLDALGDDLHVVLEITERGLDSEPSGLRAMVRAARRRGITIALDDVGSNWSTLDALRVVEPDIVKLDARVLRNPRTMRSRRVLRTVRNFVDATGAVVIAEGIEFEYDRNRAVELGATLGQGWYFGAAAAISSIPLAGDR